MKDTPPAGRGHRGPPRPWAGGAGPPAERLPTCSSVPSERSATCRQPRARAARGWFRPWPGDGGGPCAETDARGGAREGRADAAPRGPERSGCGVAPSHPRVSSYLSRPAPAAREDAGTPSQGRAGAPRVEGAGPEPARRFPGTGGSPADFPRFLVHLLPPRPSPPRSRPSGQHGPGRWGHRERCPRTRTASWPDRARPQARTSEPFLSLLRARPGDFLTEHRARRPRTLEEEADDLEQATPGAA